MHQPRNLLCIDDEAEVLRALQRVLRKEPYRVLTAQDAATALAIMARDPVQVVLCDQRMPDEPGTRLLARIKQHHPETIRIMLSGYAEPPALVEAINEAEVFRFLPKPWDDDDLRATLRAAFSRWETRRAKLYLPGIFKTELEKVRQECHTLSARCASYEEALKALLDLLPVPALGLDASGEVVLANPAASTLPEAWLHAARTSVENPAPSEGRDPHEALAPSCPRLEAISLPEGSPLRHVFLFITSPTP
ncbi:MAG: hypothetical protein KatS3mg044_1411 [Rhodothermaceae bacterium]|nr:MAG: hypothetical protein KatS3mg044_1411 [Rhodothermaceae bacterium]